MYYTSIYESLIGKLKLITDNDFLVGIYFENDNHPINDFEISLSNEHPIILLTKKWLDDYFKGLKPNLDIIPLKLEGTPFQKLVWDILLQIPYGEVMTYKNIAELITKKLNLKQMSAQAVGGAVGRNPIAIIVPCHRVVGANYNLTGFSGGIEKKIYLLAHEKIDVSKYSLPKKKNKKEHYFKYSKRELDYLSQKDKKLEMVINEVGFIKRKINPNLYLSIIESIISQQISTKAQKTILSRFYARFPNITPEIISNLKEEELQNIGISLRKASYIIGFSKDIVKKTIDLDNLENKTDQEIISILSSIKGIGKWTAEMTLIFSLSRPNILSYNDLGIKRGLKILYNLETIDQIQFKEFVNRFSQIGRASCRERV